MTEVAVYPTVLHRLLAEMEALTPEQVAAQEPQEKRGRGEEEVGLLSEPLRALHALRSLKVDQHNQLVEEHRSMHEDEIMELAGSIPKERTITVRHLEVHAQVKVLAQDIEILTGAFWTSVKEQYSCDPEARGTALRIGWKVVDVYGGKQSSFLDEIIKVFFS